MRVFYSFFVLATALLLGNEIAICNFSLRENVGRGLGYDSTYTSLDTLIVIPTFKENIYPFIDARAHILETGRLDANLGFGLRLEKVRFFDVLGLNAYYDYRKKKYVSFQQLGIGGEILSSRCNLHLNGYFPLGRSTKIAKILDCHQYSGGYCAEFCQFQKTFAGGDLTLDCILKNTPLLFCKTFLGSYYYKSADVRHFWGVRGGVQSLIMKYLSLSASITRDPLYKTRVQGEIAIRFKWGGKQFFTPVFRNEIIIVDKMEMYQWNWDY